jgi:hypothetical protein
MIVYGNQDGAKLDVVQQGFPNVNKSFLAGYGASAATRIASLAQRRCQLLSAVGSLRLHDSWPETDVEVKCAALNFDAIAEATLAQNVMLPRSFFWTSYDWFRRETGNGGPNLFSAIAAVLSASPASEITAWLITSFMWRLSREINRRWREFLLLLVDELDIRFEMLLRRLSRPTFLQDIAVIQSSWFCIHGNRPPRISLRPVLSWPGGCAA